MSGEAREGETDPGLLARALSPAGLSSEEAGRLAAGLCANRYPPAFAGALLSALATRGETVDELYGFATALRSMARAFPPPGAAEGVDLCGTGGASHPTFNVSTVAAFVVAAAGGPVVKHGNTSVRGPCGSSDLLEALGLPITTSVEFPTESFRKESLAFLHAPLFHQATKNVAPLRKSLGIRTIFNQLGPLTNPAAPKYQVVGAYSVDYGRKAVEVLSRLNCTTVLAVHGDAGTDELSPKEPSTLLLQGPHGLSMERFLPEELLAPEEREGSWEPLPPPKAAAEAEAILRGSSRGARYGAVLLTAGAALWIMDRAPGLEEGVAVAREMIASGRALSKLETLRALAKSRDWG